MDRKIKPLKFWAAVVEFKGSPKGLQAQMEIIKSFGAQIHLLNRNQPLFESGGQMENHIIAELLCLHENGETYKRAIMYYLIYIYIYKIIFIYSIT